MKPIQRLEWYLKHKKIRYNTVEKRIGLSTGYLSKQVSNLASIGSDILEKIFQAYPNLNPGWLLTGQGHFDKASESLSDNYRPAGSFGEVPDKLKFINDLQLPDKEKLELCKLYAEKLLLQIGLLERELADVHSQERNSNGLAG